MHDETRTAATDSASVARRSWDFTLTVLTVLLLGALGVQSFLGTIYTWWVQRTVPGWEQIGYAGYVSAMNAIAAPLVVALVVVMGLCVPKRLFSRRLLVLASAGMVSAGLVVWLATGKLATGLAVYLALASLIQVAVIVLTVAGAQAPSYLTEGRLTKTGSGLLHLGFAVFALLLVAFQRSAFMLPLFWLALALSVGGSTLSFYAGPLNRLLRSRRAPSDSAGITARG